MLNFLTAEMRRNPFPVYDHIRAASPVLHDPASKTWMIFDYERVKRALTDQEAFSSSMFRAGRGNPEWFIFFDPPRHTKLRGLIMKAFTPKSVANLEPRIRELTGQLLEPQLEHGEMDLVADFAAPLPMMVIAEMLGVPTADGDKFRRWGDAILALSYTVSGGAAGTQASQEYFAATSEMGAYVAALLEQRRSDPKDDLLTRLQEAEVDGERLTPKEILGFFQLLLVAGTETTTNLLNNAILCFLEQPEQLAMLRAHPELLAAAIEEVLRYRSPVQWMFRATTREIEMGNHCIPAGSLVLPVIGSANRDPRQFPNAHRFDIRRDPNPHIAFGHGAHFCIGAPLSRLEGRIALGAILARMSQIELASSEPWEPRQALHVHGPARLPIRFTAVERAASVRVCVHNA